MSHNDHDHEHNHHDHEHNHHDHKHDHHDHKHDHHGHDHKHDHEEKHDQNPSDGELSLDQKLTILIEHWIEHNKSHQGTFESWATKASEEKLIKTAELLKEISQDSILITKKLEKALQSIKS